jgi:hypothetical protein
MNFEPQTRKWIYGIIAAIVPLFVTLGYLTPEIARELLAIAAALLTVAGSALAIKNVPTVDKETPEEEKNVFFEAGVED